MNRDNFFIKFYNKLPVEIQLKIFLSVPEWKPPKSKFKKDMIVELIYEEKEKFWGKNDALSINKQYQIYMPMMGDSPCGKLKIVQEPKWNKNMKEWTYSLEYGPFGRSNITKNETKLVEKN